MQGSDQLFHVFRVFVVRACNQDVHVRRVAAFNDQCVFFRVQLGFQRVVGVDQRQINLGQHTWNRRCFQLTELQVFRVLGNVLDRRQDVFRILELDQPRLVQQQQRTAAVGGIVRDHHGGAVFKLIKLFVFAGVSAQRLKVHGRYADEVSAFGFVELIQVRLVLEEVGVQTLFRHLYVGLNVVSEHLDLEVHALFSQSRLYEFQDLSVRDRARRHRQITCVGRKCRYSGHSSK